MKRVNGSIDQPEGSVLDRVRTPPTGEGVHPPVVTRAPYLPLDKLAWPDVERLFLRLAERDGNQAEDAQLYGTPGQSQEGIDLFVRNTVAPSAGGSLPPRRYTTLQSKRVATLNASEIRKAVDRFLKGEWAARSEIFIYATTHDLTPTQLAGELNRQADRLEKQDIHLVRWGRAEVSEMLRNLPHVVDDFFGRQWVKRFCGAEAAEALDRPDASAQWPRQVGVVPPRAEAFLYRAEVEQLHTASKGGGTTVLHQVLTGMGGIGKTQLAANHAHQALHDKTVDLVVWVDATSRHEILQAFGQAGIEVASADPANVDAAPKVFLAWLNTTDQRWLVILDNVQDPTDLGGLWPPDRPSGQVIATARRRDPALRTSTRQLIEVGLFSAKESLAYLVERLAVHGLSEAEDELVGLAADLGHLPLALAQAASYLIDLADTGVTVSQYRVLLRDRRPLAELAPDPAALPDDQETTLAVILCLSLNRADQHTAGLATPLLQLTSLLDPPGIPASVFTTSRAIIYLTGSRASQSPAARTDESAPDGYIGSNSGPVSMVAGTEVLNALRHLHRFNLVSYSPRTPTMSAVVRVHALTQHAAYDTVPPAFRGSLARAAGAALLEAWPEPEQSAVASMLRASTFRLNEAAGDALWDPDYEPNVLLKAGISLGDSGQYAAAADFFTGLQATAACHFGWDDYFTLRARHHQASWRGEAGDAAGAAQALAGLLEDRVRILGPDDPNTLATRQNHARYVGEAGNVEEAVRLLKDLLPLQLSILGPDHPQVLVMRNYLATWEEDPDQALYLNEQLLADEIRILGPDDPKILTTRENIAHYARVVYDGEATLAALEALLSDQLRILGPDHPNVLSTQSDLALHLGDTQTASAKLEELLDHQRNALGSAHPRTLITRHKLIKLQSELQAAPTPVSEYEELLHDVQRVFGHDHPNTLTARHSLAYSHHKAGDTQRAVSELEELLNHVKTIPTPTELVIGIILTLREVQTEITARSPQEKLVKGDQDHSQRPLRE
ncbi:tetratricopeptide repeat protein [Streptomyces hirsutus]